MANRLRNRPPTKVVRAAVSTGHQARRHEQRGQAQITSSPQPRAKKQRPEQQHRGLIAGGVALGASLSSQRSGSRNNSPRPAAPSITRAGRVLPVARAVNPGRASNGRSRIATKANSARRASLPGNTQPRCKRKLSKISPAATSIGRRLPISSVLTASHRPSARDLSSRRNRWSSKWSHARRVCPYTQLARSRAPNRRQSSSGLAHSRSFGHLP